MPDPRVQLETCLRGRVCVVGVGNVDFGDDGFGVRLAEALRPREAVAQIFNLPYPRLTACGALESTRNFDDATPCRLQVGDTADCKSALQSDGAAAAEILVAGANPERFLARLSSGAFDTIMFLDAVELKVEPGSAGLLDSTTMGSCFPQVSTHKISLGLLARMIEANCAAKVWLLGVQPGSLRPGDSLSAAVQDTLDLLLPILSETLGTPVFTPERSPC